MQTIDDFESRTPILRRENKELTYWEQEYEDILWAAANDGFTEFVDILTESTTEKTLKRLNFEVESLTKEKMILGADIALIEAQVRLIEDATDAIYNNIDNAYQIRKQIESELARLPEKIASEAVFNLEGHNPNAVIPFNDALIYRSQLLVRFKERHLNVNVSLLSVSLHELKDKALDYQERIAKIDEEVTDIREIIKLSEGIRDKNIQRKEEKLQELIRTTLKDFKSPHPLFLHSSNTVAIRQLATLGMSVNHKNGEKGNSLLHVAILKNYFTLAQLLIEKGADPLIKNHEGITPLTLATKHSESRYLTLFNNGLERTDFMLDELRNVYIKEIQELLSFLELAKKALKQYGDKLTSRKDLLKIVRILLGIEFRFEKRCEEYEQYFLKLKEASYDLDPQAFFTFVERQAHNAPRGLLNRSQLHDSLSAISTRFNAIFDAHSFNQHKELFLLCSTIDPTSPISRRHFKEVSTLRGENKKLKDKSKEKEKEVSELKRENEELRFRVEAIEEKLKIPATSSSDSNSGLDRVRRWNNG